VLFAATSDGWPARRWLVGAMVGLWAGRLATYLLFNRVLGKPEDGRYVTLRKKWGEAADQRFFVFFQAQAALAWMFGLPALVVARIDTPEWTAWDATGVCIWVLAVANEALADAQLARFRARPENHGRACRDGWWRFSRHPNYFFEWVHWWSYAAMAVGAAGWWVTVAAPALLLFFLLRVTGIGPTEKQAASGRGEDYRRYQRTTSRFIPWIPRREVRDGNG
jgi:steroid 5-alpha reductase family enzyme